MDVAKRVFLIMVGLLLTALGLHILYIYDLTFGGTAGIATALTNSTEISWSIWFFIVNLPFFIISFKSLGKWFTFYSLLAITAISIIGELLLVIQSTALPILMATIIAGLLIGIGVTFVLNNGSSIGGIHILALYLDQKLKINRGVTIFVIDFIIILTAIQMVGWQNGLLSILAIMIPSYIIGRYKKNPMKTTTEHVESREREKEMTLSK
ncbi:YitT family protein [Bacillus sp. FJAT-45350]|uniref:YitT family protein n=1 Tax=Bacillus sp. FJAT-45350 TaxID=2011014 RepID=UPI000BB684B8|nr:YitT family protein [Bacillus sp. FJAT-45350]